MSKAFSFYVDPGHGWLAVRHDQLADLDLTPADFTQYSHIDGVHIYLEEDCDAGKFIDAFEARHGHKPELRERHTNIDSFIRRRPRNAAGKWSPFSR